MHSLMVESFWFCLLKLQTKYFIIKHILFCSPPYRSNISLTLFPVSLRDKILNLHSKLLSCCASVSPPHRDPSAKPFRLRHFGKAIPHEVVKLITSAPNKQYELDPIPNSLLNVEVMCWREVPLPTTTNTVYLSLSCLSLSYRSQTASQKDFSWQGLSLRLSSYFQSFSSLPANRTHLEISLWRTPGHQLALQ